MPYEPRADQLARRELELLQQKVLREWRRSDWLAANDPRAWEALDAQDPEQIVLDLGGGIGESAQVPGAIVIGSGYASRRELQDRTGEERLPDLNWSLNDGLPVEAQSVDVVHIHNTLGDLSSLALARLPKELARALPVGGTVFVIDKAPLVRRLGNQLEEQGFDLESLSPVDGGGLRGRFALGRQKRPLEEVQPHAIEDVAMGELRIREPRQPYRR